MDSGQVSMFIIYHSKLTHKTDCDCVTNRGRMYATLGPNWRVPLRNSPRSCSYVYRYSELARKKMYYIYIKEDVFDLVFDALYQVLHCPQSK